MWGEMMGEMMGREGGREVFFSSSLSFIFPGGGFSRFTYCTYTDVFSFLFFLVSCFNIYFQQLSPEV